MEQGSQGPALPIVMSADGSDPSGGGGLQGHVLTFDTMGCRPPTVVTAETVQDTAGVNGVWMREPGDEGGSA